MDRPASNSSFASAKTSCTADERGKACATALSRLKHVHNARDLAEALPGVIKPGRLFRSGSPAAASEADALVLRRDLAIQCFVDFRSSAEHKEDRSWPHLLSEGVIKTYDASGGVEEETIDSFPGLVQEDEAPLPPAELHRLSLLERSKFIRGLLPHLPYWTVAAAAWYKLIGDEQGMRGAIVPVLNEGGLLLIYQILLETSGAELARTLGILLDAAQRRRPALFFCKLGKDRTGTAAALALAACGAPRDAIVADYARSHGLHEVALGGIEKMDDTQGMDASIFESAPPEAMHALIDYAEENYGGLRGYMTKIGFGADKQDALRAALSQGDW